MPDCFEDRMQIDRDCRIVVARLLRELRPREADVIRMRWLDEALTLEQAGARLGVSKERVRQIELSAFRKARRWYECWHVEARSAYATMLNNKG